MQHRNRTLHACVLTLCLTIGCAMPLSVQAAGTDDASLVDLTLSDCPTVSQAETHRILRLEIQSISERRRIFPRKTALHIACEDNAFILNMTDSETAEVLTRRRLVKQRVTAGNERVIAIAAAELVLSAWEKIAETTHPEALSNGESTTLFSPTPASRTPASADPPFGSMTPSTPKDEPPKETAETPPQHTPDPKNKSIAAAPKNVSKNNSKPPTGKMRTLRLSAGSRLYPKTRTFLFGGELGGGLQLMGPLELQLTVAAEGGRIPRDMGTVALLFVGGGLSLGLIRTMASNRLLGRAHLGVRAGYGRLQGHTKTESSRGNTVTGPLGGPFLRLGLSSFTRVMAGVSAEVGTTAIGVFGRIASERNVSMQGVWLMVFLDVAIHTP